MQKLLEEDGYEIVPFHEKADVYVINTCTVTNIADRKSRQMLHRARKLNPEAVIVAAGCYVQAQEEAGQAIEGIDILIGNNQKKNLISLLHAHEQHEDIKAVIDINHTGEFEELYVDSAGDHTRAYIKIQDGCNQFCTYCIIPYVRGRIRSRQPGGNRKRSGTACGCRLSGSSSDRNSCKFLRGGFCESEDGSGFLGDYGGRKKRSSLPDSADP